MPYDELTLSEKRYLMIESAVRACRKSSKKVKIANLAHLTGLSEECILEVLESEQVRSFVIHSKLFPQHPMDQTVYQKTELNKVKQA
ncbi:hypothetical protein N781_08370 [Pontibacillus halophilus JSM 076056 = DSM 19796]|uniref:Uncharacterized protein n=1 Tax=Pontibacillus halophilus JSM 076056 = DSM 19796 TaxID=1385510 RepID=A0A0A5GGA3_9BACI|nr:hypothetical protein N781_08370 [Pontibacillus halophilus JSM 076056 = DSM 19796]